MKINFIHDFNISIDYAMKLQKEYSTKLELNFLKKKPSIVAGADVSYLNNKGIAVVCIFDFETHELLETKSHIGETNFEYKSGLLAFRELPLILNTFSNIDHEPDIIFFDGHGIIHPLNMGLATHASFFLNKPTIGVAKTPFIGSYTTPINKKGEFTNIMYNDEVIGFCLRTRVGSKPVYVSPGNFISLQESLGYVNHFVTNSRLPITTLIPDEISKKLKKDFIL